jgi:endonuclease YncB( thermonuclease family)
MPRIAAILAALACLPAVAAEPHTFTGKAVSVHDGDTLHVLDDAKQEHTIRLDGRWGGRR